MNYSGLLQSIESAHAGAKSGAAGTVNRFLVLRNWLIGAFLIEYQQQGADRAEYGTGLLKRVSSDLRERGVSGCSPQMLERARLFYRRYPQVAGEISSPLVRIFDNALLQSGLEIPPPPVRKSEVPREAGAREPRPLPVHMLLRLSWSHILELLGIDDPWKRAFFENECLKGNWSKRQLQRQIGSLLYERTGLSADKQAVIQAGREQSAESPQSVDTLIRDAYVLEFTGLAELPRYQEAELETALLDHLQAFLLELGTGFCFEARQRRITVGNEHDYVDLVFYHRKLRCHLLIDLKVRAFQHGDAGQMNFYLNYWKDREMEPADDPPLGLILCAGKDSAKVEYATAGIDQQLFVSRYLVALPKPEELERLIENDRALWEQRHRETNPD